MLTVRRNLSKNKPMPTYNATAVLYGLLALMPEEYQWVVDSADAYKKIEEKK